MILNQQQQKMVKQVAVQSLEVLAASLAIVCTDANAESLWSGGIIAVLGAGLFTWAGGFQRMEREGVLTLGGPYRFVRHPWILARFMMVFGIILMARLPWLFLAAMAALAPMYRRLTRDEDQWMERQLGPKAAEYKALVAGFVPQFMPAKLPQSWRSINQEGFSWHRALWRRPGRGGLALAGVAVAMVGMYIWTEHWIPAWLWRSVAALTMSGAIWWLIKDRGRVRRLGRVRG
jgi:protein-S-isoprenylcysteine O-methyltransferase Ste14